jgi:hypothetical protein
MVKLVSLGMLVVLLLACCPVGALLNNPGGLPISPKLPGVGDLPIPGIGNKTIDLSSAGDMPDIPPYPNAKQAGDKVTIPGPLALLTGQWQTQMQGVAYRFYTTNDEVNKVSEWYKQQMPGQGWTEEQSPFQAGEFNLLFFKKDNDKTTGVIYLNRDAGTKETQILLIRAEEKAQQ